MIIGAKLSKSIRKTPIFGHTSATSEKKDKQILNRAMRSKNKQLIKTTTDWDEFIPFEKDDIMSTWEMEKDGKSYFDKQSQVRTANRVYKYHPYRFKMTIYEFIKYFKAKHKFK